MFVEKKRKSKSCYNIKLIYLFYITVNFYFHEKSDGDDILYCI